MVLVQKETENNNSVLLFNEKKHPLQRQLNLKNNLTATFTDLAVVTFKINRVSSHLVRLANKICS